MASFTNLKNSRKARAEQSYVSQNKTSKEDVPISSAQSPETTDNPTPAASAMNLHSLPASIEIKTSTAGRGLYANIHLRPGDVIMVVRPHVAVLSNQYLGSYCSNCFGPTGSSGLKRCATCRVVHYCDSTCQSKDWSSHKNECSALRKWRESAPSDELAYPSDAVRCLGRLLWRKQKKGSDSKWAQEINSLQSHRTSLAPSSYEVHTHLSHALVRYLGVDSPGDLATFDLNSASDLVDLTSRFITNTFAVTTPTLTPIGVSVSPAIALINHSCDPNAVVVFPRVSANPSTSEPEMQVVALRLLKPGEEVLTAYIDTTLPREIRQQSLKETYNFECNCSLCAAPGDPDPRASVVCPKSCGGTCPAPTEENSLSQCHKCKAVVKDTDAVLDAFRIGQEALNKATALEFQGMSQFHLAPAHETNFSCVDPAKAIQLTSKLIPILVSAGATPTSHPLLALSRLYQSLLVSSLPDPLTQDALDDAIRVAARCTAGLSNVLQPGHPVRGIALAEQGKLLAVDEPSPKEKQTPAEAALLYPPSGPARLRSAFDVLRRARQELLVGFGTRNEGGAVGKEVRDTVAAIEKELGVWNQGVKNVLNDGPAALK